MTTKQKLPKTAMKNQHFKRKREHLVNCKVGAWLPSSDIWLLSSLSSRAKVTRRDVVVVVFVGDIEGIFSPRLILARRLLAFLSQCAILAFGGSAARPAVRQAAGASGCTAPQQPPHVHFCASWMLHNVLLL